MEGLETVEDKFKDDIYRPGDEIDLLDLEESAMTERRREIEAMFESGEPKFEMNGDNGL